MTNYNLIAPVYDWLARLVFGKHLLDAQTRFLDHIQNGQKVLIIGGGTGQLLSYFRKTDLMIDFVEPSHAMIKIAKKRTVQNGVRVNFYTYEILQHPIIDKYDVVICPFVLDVFESHQLNKVLDWIKTAMHQSSYLVVSDFSVDKNKFWQQMLSGSMHLFFRFTTGLQNKAILSIDQIVRSKGFKCVNTQYYYKSFIFSKKYAII